MFSDSDNCIYILHATICFMLLPNISTHCDHLYCSYVSVLPAEVAYWRDMHNRKVSEDSKQVIRALQISISQLELLSTTQQDCSEYYLFEDFILIKSQICASCHSGSHLAGYRLEVWVVLSHPWPWSSTYRLKSGIRSFKDCPSTIFATPTQQKDPQIQLTSLQCLI